MSNPHGHLGHEVGKAVLNLTPPVAVWSLGLNEVFVTLSIVYLLFQISYLLWKWRKEIAARRADKAAIESLMRGRVAKPGERAPT